MARINIDDSLFRDSRYIELTIKLGNPHHALGLVCGAWILAQKHWVQHKSIPEKAWPAHYQMLIDVGLATRRPDGTVYVKGSKKAFAWLEQRVAAGRNGGIKKAAKLAESKRELAKDSGTLAPAEPPKTPKSKNRTIAERGALLEFSDPVYADLLKEVTHNLQKTWLQVYREPNFIEGEFRKAKVWIEANPRKRPQDFGKFLSNWLSRSFESFRKGIPSRRQTTSELNAQVAGELYQKAAEGTL